MPPSPLAYLTLSGGGGGNNATTNYDNSARHAFNGLLETARDHYENKLLRIAGCLAEKVRPVACSLLSTLCRHCLITPLLPSGKVSWKRFFFFMLRPGLAPVFVLNGLKRFGILKNRFEPIVMPSLR